MRNAWQVLRQENKASSCAADCFEESHNSLRYVAAQIRDPCTSDCLDTSCTRSEVPSSKLRSYPKLSAQQVRVHITTTDGPRVQSLLATRSQVENSQLGAIGSRHWQSRHSKTEVRLYNLCSFELPVAILQASGLVTPCQFASARTTVKNCWLCCHCLERADF